MLHCNRTATADIGTLTDGTEFDSSYKRGKPTTFAPSQVVAGWAEAMQLMAEGDRWQLVLPSELAYGDAHRGAYITPGAVLVFELEIIRVEGAIAQGTAVVHTAASRAALTTPPSGVPPLHAEMGKRVQIIGLQSTPQFNDQRGTVVSWDPAKQRAGVQLDSGGSFALKPANLWPCQSTEGEGAEAPEPAAPRTQVAPTTELAAAKAAAADANAEPASTTPTHIATTSPPLLSGSCMTPETRDPETRDPETREVVAEPAAVAAGPLPAAATVVLAPAAATVPAPDLISEAAAPPPPAATTDALPDLADASTTLPASSTNTQRAPVVASDEWRTGLRELPATFFRAAGTEPGGQAVVMAGDDTVATRTYEGDDEKVGLYSVATGEALMPLAGHSDVITALAVDGDVLASASADGSARVWRLGGSGSSECLARLSVGDAVLGIAVRGRFVVTGDAAGGARLWQLGARSAAVAADVHAAVAAEADDAERPPQASTCEAAAAVLLSRQSHTAKVRCVGVTRSGAACSVGWRQTDFKLWGGGRGGRGKDEAPEAALDVTDVADATDATDAIDVTLSAKSGHALIVEGDRAYLGLCEGWVAVYDAECGQPRHLLRANTASREVMSLAARELGRDVLLVACCEYAPQALRVLLLENFVPGARTPRPVLLANHDTFHAVLSLSLSESGGLVVATGDDGELEVFAPNGGEAVVPRYAMEEAPQGLTDEPGVEMSKDGLSRMAW